MLCPLTTRTHSTPGLEEARLWLQAGWDLTDSADRRYGERRISELECQSDAPPVEAVGQQGADASELASATLTADEVRSAIAGSVRTQDDGKVVADEEAMTRLLNETLASKATPAGAAVGVEAVRTTLETHTWDDEDGCAGCGWTPDSEATWAEHILALLAAPRTEKPGGRR